MFWFFKVMRMETKTLSHRQDSCTVATTITTTSKTFHLLWWRLYASYKHRTKDSKQCTVGYIADNNIGKYNQSIELHLVHPRSITTNNGLKTARIFCLTLLWRKRRSEGKLILKTNIFLNIYSVDQILFSWICSLTE